MKLDDIHQILIIGAGTMGQQIGLQCAMHGYTVTLYDLEPKALQSALAQIKVYAEGLVSAGRLSREAADAAVGRFSATTDPAEAAANADLVSESIPENPELKGKVFARFNALCPPHTIFTTKQCNNLVKVLIKCSSKFITI